MLKEMAPHGISWIFFRRNWGLKYIRVIFDKEHIKKELNSGRPIICILGPGDFSVDAVE